MKQPKGFKEHTICPKEWKCVPNMTGDHITDGAIMQNPNRDLKARLDMYLTEGNAYGYRTAYNGYDGYHGDE